MNKWVPEQPRPWRKSCERESCYGDRVYGLAPEARALDHSANLSCLRRLLATYFSATCHASARIMLACEKELRNESMGQGTPNLPKIILTRIR